MINKNFLILGIASIFVFAVIATPHIFAGSDEGGFPSVANPNDIISQGNDFSLANQNDIISQGNDFSLAALDVDTNAGSREPHIAVNPLDSTNVAVASVGNLLKLSTDTGATFPIMVNPVMPVSLVNIGGYGFCGDPSLTFDSQGRFFWSYLACSFSGGNLLDLSVVVVQVNPITGAIIGTATDLTPGINIDDKNWIIADENPLSPNADNLYIVWTDLGVTRVTFSMSTDQGANWTPNQAVSVAGEGFVWPPHITTAPNGDVYVTYPTNACAGGTSTIQVLRDTNGGSQLAAGVGFQKATSFGLGQADITCNVQSVAGAIPGSASWMQGSQAAYTMADPLVAGKIYVIGNDDPDNDFTAGDSADVVMIISLNNGVNWGAPFTIGPANSGTFQVMPTGAIDEFGNIAVTWYDSRSGNLNGANNNLLDLYGTFSTDGGASFTAEFLVSDNQFDPDLGASQRFAGPPPTLRIGEYNGIAVQNCLAYAVWTGNDGNNHEIYFDTFAVTGICEGEVNAFKYEDIEFDGSFNNNDVPIQDWEICIFADGDEPDPVNAIECLDTDANGEVTFANLLFGDYVACEEFPNDWTNESELCQDVTIDINNRDPTVNFGNFENGSVEALKYNDLDTDTIFNNADVPIQDWEICIFADGDEPDPVNAIECQDTDANGEVLFENLGPGDYVACEEDQTEWVHTTDDCVAVVIDVSGEQEDVEFGNVRPIEAEKTWTHTDYNWGLICDEPNPEPPFDCLVEERPREIDIPTDEVLAEPLPESGDKYIAEATTVKNKVKNVTPGAFYALTTIEINVDLDSLTVDEIYADCYDGQDLIKFVSKNKVSRNVKIAVADSDGVVTELSDDIYDEIGGKINVINNSHAEIEITDSDNLKAGNTVYVLVKFQHDLKNEPAPGNVFDQMCDNDEAVTAELLSQDVEILAEASLRITSET